MCEDLQVRIVEMQRGVLADTREREARHNAETARLWASTLDARRGEPGPSSLSRFAAAAAAAMSW